MMWNFPSIFVIAVYISVTFGSSAQTDNVLNVLWMAPNQTLSDLKGRPVFSAASSIGALAMALDRVLDEGLLGDKKIKMLSQHIGKPFALHQIDHKRGIPDGYLKAYAQSLSAAMVPVADLAAFYNIPVFGWVSDEHELDNKTRASTLVRSFPPLSGLGKLLLYLCRIFKWHLLAIISSTGRLSQGIADNLQENIDNDPYFTLARHISNVKSNLTSAGIRKIMATLKKEARIIFLIIPNDLLRNYLLAAHDEGMTSGDFQFLYSVQTLRPESYVNVLRSEAMWKRNDSRDDDARQAYRNLLYLTFTFILEWNLNQSELVNVTYRVYDLNCTIFPDLKPTTPGRDFVYNGEYLPKIHLNSLDQGAVEDNSAEEMVSNGQRDLHSRFLHDAFYLFARAYNTTLTNNQTATGQNLFDAATSIQFQGLTGNVTINANGDRMPGYILWDMAPDNTFRIVLQMFYTVNASGDLVLNFVRNPPGIYWGNGKSQDEDNYIPSDTPRCGFNDEFCATDSTVRTVILVVVALIMLAAVIVFFIMYRWWKKEQELNRRNWRVKWTQLKFDDPAKLAPGMTNSRLSGSQTTLSDKSDHNPSAGDISAISSLLSRETAVTHMATFCKTALLDGNRVAIRMIRKKNIRMERKLLDELRLLTTLRHTNLATFHGVCTDPPNLCILWEYCHKGSIQDVFSACRANDYKLDSMVQFSIAVDICSGLAYLHDSALKVHGNLKSSNCLIDKRWTCKLSGFGQDYLVKGEKPDTAADEQAQYSKLFWTAPEVLRLVLKGEKYTPGQHADIYSVAIVLKEVLSKSEAYEEEVHHKGMTAKDIISKVSEPQGDTLFRPCICDLPDEPASVVVSIIQLIHASWQEEPCLRPTAHRLLRRIKKLNPFKMVCQLISNPFALHHINRTLRRSVIPPSMPQSPRMIPMRRSNNIMDNMIQMMEKYSSRLEELVAHRTSQLEDEKRKTDALLCRMLPQKVAEDLKRGQHVQAEAFTSVTIYFSDIVGFTQIASQSTPMEIVDFLNRLYTVFDDIIQVHDVYKVETIGDAYMVVSGVPVPNGQHHVTVIANMALDILRTLVDFVIPHMPETQLRIRIGLNTGPVVAGVVGNIMPRYCLFGDTVNVASRMESHGSPLKIHLSPYTYEVLKEHTEYIVTERGLIDIKGRGKMRTYFLEGRKDEERSSSQEHLMETSQSEVKNASTINLHDFSQETLLSGKDNSVETNA